jgi:hypothetical protein
LFADDALVKTWAERLAALDRSRIHQNSADVELNCGESGYTPPDPWPFRIGIVWQGNPRHELDRYRSIPLAEFAPLARVPGVQLVSLQQQAGREQLQQLRGKFTIVELHEPEAGWADTAAQVQNLDLVISVDTAVAHLAGGLGKPVWVPLSAVGEWRWLLHREDSPWYPTLRLFRQRRLGHWRDVFQRMARTLKRAGPHKRPIREADGCTELSS